MRLPVGGKAIPTAQTRSLHPMLSRFLFLLGLCACARTLAAVDLPTKEDARLIPAYQSHRVWNGFASTRGGRVFVCYPGADGPG